MYIGWKTLAVNIPIGNVYSYNIASCCIDLQVHDNVIFENLIALNGCLLNPPSVM